MPLPNNENNLPKPVDSALGVGSLVAIRRYELRMTQNQVAELAGISLRNLKKIEAGQANPGLQPLLRLLYVLGLELTLDKRATHENQSR